MRQYDASLLDAFIPRCRRLTQLHFGRIVSNPDAPQAFSKNVGFNMTYNLVEPGKGNALHTHPSVEIFIALDGRWEIAWGERGEHKATLEPWDIVAVPAFVRHSYKNASTEKTAHHIMTILPGAAAITWAPDVVSEARSHGALCTNRGQLLDFWGAARKDGECDGESAAESVPETDDEDEAPDAYHLPISAEEMARHVRRHAEGRALCVEAGESHLQTGWRRLGRGEQWLLAESGGEAVDTLLVVLEGALMLTRANGRVVEVATTLDAVRLPAEEASGLVAVNQFEAPCTFLLVESSMRALVDRRCDEWHVGDSRRAAAARRAPKRPRGDGGEPYPRAPGRELRTGCADA